MKLEKILIFPIAVFIALLFYVANIGITGPVVQGDEGGYIAYAAAFAGYFADTASSYHAGYSFVISPAYWHANNPDTAFETLRLINSLQWGLTTLVIYGILKRIFPDETVGRLIVITAICMLYPAWITISGYAFSENSYVLIYVFSVYLLIRLLESGGIYWVYWWSSIAFLYMIHPKAAVVITSAFITSAIVVVGKREVKYLLAAIAVSLISISLYKHALMPWVIEQMNVGDFPLKSHYPSLSKLIAPFTDIEKMSDIIVRSIGQVVYLGYASLGILLLPLMLSYKWCIDNKKNFLIKLGLNNNPVFLFLALSLLGTILLSSITLTAANGERFDHWMYGRYIEGVLLPVLAIALMIVLKKETTIPFWMFFLLTIVFLLLLPDGRDVAHLNITSFWPHIYAEQKPHWMQFAFASIPLVLLYFIKNRKNKLYTIALVFLFSGLSHVFKVHVEHNRTHGDRHKNAYLIRELYKKETCVAFDRSSSKNWWHPSFLPHYAHYLYDYKLTQLRPESWNALCDGPILSWDDKLDEKYPDAYPYAKEKRDGPILWIIPDHTMKNSQVKAYDLIKFSDALNSVRYLTSGWYATEKWGVWSEEDAKISLTLPNNCAIDGNCILRLKMHLFNATNSAPKSIHIGINGTNINSFIVVDGAPHSYTVPLKTNNSNIELTIKVPEAVSPSVSGLSDDKRTLGVGLHSIQLTYN